MTAQELTPFIAVAGVLLTLIWNIYQATVGRQKADQVQDARITALETKVGLFWHLVEEHMSSMLAKANPIHLEPNEKAAARVYDVYKSKSPTHILKMLAIAVDRELKKQYMSSDETMAFTCILGAIKSQLYDRGEWRPEHDST